MVIKYQFVKKILGEYYADPLNWTDAKLKQNNTEDKRTLIQIISDLLQCINEKAVNMYLGNLSYHENKCYQDIQSLYNCTPIKSDILHKLAVLHGDMLYDIVSHRFCILSKNPQGRKVMFVKRSGRGPVSPLTIRLSLTTLVAAYKLVINLILYPYMVRVFKTLIKRLNGGETIVVPLSPTRAFVLNNKTGNWFVSYDTICDSMSKYRTISMQTSIYKNPREPLLASTLIILHQILVNSVEKISLSERINTEIAQILNQI